MPEEEFPMSPKEREAIQRLANAKKVPFDEVVEFVAVNALMSYPREDDGAEDNAK